MSSDGFTVALPAGSLTDNPTGDSRTFQVNIPNDGAQSGWSIGAWLLPENSCPDGCFPQDGSCRQPKFIHPLTIPSALCADANNNKYYNYDYKVRVGVRNTLVLPADPEDTSNPQKKGGVPSITLCGESPNAAALDSGVYWSELSDVNPIGIG